MYLFFTSVMKLVLGNLISLNFDPQFDGIVLLHISFLYCCQTCSNSDYFSYDPFQLSRKYIYSGLQFYRPLLWVLIWVIGRPFYSENSCLLCLKNFCFLCSPFESFIQHSFGLFYSYPFSSVFYIFAFWLYFLDNFLNLFFSLLSFKFSPYSFHFHESLFNFQMLLFYSMLFLFHSCIIFLSSLVVTVYIFFIFFFLPCLFPLTCFFPPILL